MNDLRVSSFGEVSILVALFNREIEALKARVSALELDGRPLGWELTAEANRAHADEQAVGGNAPPEWTPPNQKGE